MLAVTANAAPPPRNLLLVYYANETSERVASSQTYAVLQAAIAKSTNPDARALGPILSRDAVAFPAAVQSDAAALTEAAVRLRFDLAIFTNALAYEHRYLLVRGATGSGAIESRALRELAPAASPILADSPLSRGDFLRAALSEAGNAYAPASLDIILITNTHGARDIALTPRVFADLSKTDPEALLAELDGAPRAGELRPLGTLARGTSKLEYWRAIADVAAARDIRFPLVFRQSCESGLSGWSELQLLPASVGAIAHTANGSISYRDIDYAAVFANPGSPFSLVEQLAAELRKRGVQVDSRESMWQWLVRDAAFAALPYLLIVPLLAWLAWYGRYYLAAALRRASRKAA